MDNFFKKLPVSESSSKRGRIEATVENIIVDPGLRSRMSDYNANDRDEIRRQYLLKGPCQPRHHQFPQTKFGNTSKTRRFNYSWFDQFPSWLEYSVAKDAAFCMFCYLFKPEMGQQSGGDSFTVNGFRNWKDGLSRLREHVGGPNSIHNQASVMCTNLMKSSQHIEIQFHKQTEVARTEYKTRLTASVDCIRFLIQQGLAFRGNDESDSSTNQGNFLELLRFLGDHNNEVNKVILHNAPENNKLTAPEIQKDIINAMAVETLSCIKMDIGDSFFSILIDESRDISTKEQMAIAVRYVNGEGHVIERFLGIVHVSDTSAHSLKGALEEFFLYHGFSISKLRGQGYDGASNMRGEFNGLKALIMKDNPSAYYIHCFAHQLQLTLVAVAKTHVQVAWLFELTTTLTNIINVSCKRQELLRESQFAKITEALEKGELLSGTGLNQERSLKRSGDTRWGSHYGSLLNIIVMFSSIIDVLEIVEKDPHSSSDHKATTFSLLDSLQSFDFVIVLFLMRDILGITNGLSQALQRKDQDISNAMHLVKICKQIMHEKRDKGWQDLLDEVSLFCNSYKITIPDMNALYVARGRSRRRIQEMTNSHRYRVEIFYTVIDMQLQELNNRFTETNTELLLCVASLSPNNSFSTFDKQKLRRLAEFYPSEFSNIDIMELNCQLETYIYDVRADNDFAQVIGISDLAIKMVETKKDILYPLVYLLLKLSLTLPVATATVERAFSAMNIVKNRLRNRMGDSMMNDCLITYIERDIFKSIDNNTIIKRFQNMKSRRGQL